MPERTTVAAPVSEVRATSMVGLLVGAGEVAGQPQDDAGQHDADDHGADRHEAADPGVTAATEASAPVRSRKDEGRYTRAAIEQSTAEITAEM